MTDTIITQISDLLPELFDPKNRKLKPGGLCTPGSGCGPAKGKVETDILKILADNDPSVPEEPDEPGDETR